MLLLEDKRFYVYVYIYLDPRKQGNYKYENYFFDYEPFYVGKGCKNRLYAHLKEAEKYEKQDCSKKGNRKKLTR